MKVLLVSSETICILNLIGLNRLCKTDHKAQKKPRNVGGAEYAYAYITHWQTPTNGGRPEFWATPRGRNAQYS